MLRDYEFTMIVRPDLSEEDIGAVLAHYEQKIADRDGSVLSKDAVGTKRFSYPIKKCFRGYYVNYNIAADPKVVKDMEHQMRFDAKVLRYLIIGMDRRRSAAVRAEIAAEQQRIAAAQAESAARLSESSVSETPPDSARPELSKETVIDRAPSGGEVTASDGTLSASEATETEAAASLNTETAMEGVSPTSEDTVVDKAPPLTEETVIDSGPAGGEEDEKV